MTSLKEESFIDSAYYFIFGRPVIITAEQNIKKWQNELKNQQRSLDRQIRNIIREEAKIVREIKLLVKKGEESNAKILVREIIRSRKQVVKLTNLKAQLNSIVMQLNQNLTNYKTGSILSKSVNILKIMNDIVKYPELHQTILTMGYEMEKAGLIETELDNALTIDDDDDIEVNVEEEIGKVYDEFTLNIHESTPSINSIVKPPEINESKSEEKDIILQEKISTINVK
jgi:charged multivesicular body protein 3